MTPPPAAWQKRAEALAAAAEAALWRPEGCKALAYLRGRGFADETVRRARLGYIAEDLRETATAWGLGDRPHVWVPRGVAIPWRACGVLWRLNVRRPAGDPKYAQPAGGSGAALYGVDGVRGDRPVLLVEGELDALAAWQEAGDLVAPVATGSTSCGRHPRWRRRLQTAPAVLVAYDADDAGEAAAQWWLEQLPAGARLRPVGGKDAAALLEAGGGRLRQWIAEALT